MEQTIYFTLQEHKETLDKLSCGAPDKIPYLPINSVTCPSRCKSHKLFQNEFLIENGNIIITNYTKVKQKFVSLAKGVLNKLIYLQKCLNKDLCTLMEGYVHAKQDPFTLSNYVVCPSINAKATNSFKTNFKMKTEILSSLIIQR